MRNVLFELPQADSLRFGQLKSAIGGVTNKIPPHVEYSLSERGKALYPIFLEIINWAVEYGVEEKMTNKFK